MTTVSHLGPEEDPDRLADPHAAAVAKGIAGEQLVRAALERQLAGTDVLIRHGIRFLVWGDIDHLAIGPGGITVIDTKNWSGAVRVRAGAPRIGRWGKRNEVEKLRRQCAGVRLALLNARPDLRGTEVRGVLCLAGDPDRAPEPLRDGLLLCGSAAAATLAARPGVLSPDEIAHIDETLVRCLPQVRRAEVDALLGEAGVQRRPARSSRSRRRTRRRLMARVLTALGTLISGLFVAYMITKLHVVFPGAHPRVTHLRVAEGRRGPAVSFTAPRGELVQLTLSRPHHRRSVHLTATGTRQQWRVPPGWQHIRDFSVRGCVIDGSHHCLAPSARAQLRIRTRRARTRRQR